MEPAEAPQLPRRMLALLTEGGIASTAGLARRLGVSEGLVGLMAADLARRGYLAPLEGGCHGGCSGCHVASACAAPDAMPSAMLILTPKGRQAAASE